MQKKHIYSPALLLKTAWLTLSCLILIITLLFFDNQTNSDIEDFLIYSMLLLTFPSGVIAQWLMFAMWCIFKNVSNGYEITFSVSHIYLTFVWLFLVTIGYIQWFFLLPLIFHNYKKPKYYRNDPE